MSTIQPPFITAFKKQTWRSVSVLFFYKNYSNKNSSSHGLTETTRVLLYVIWSHRVRRNWEIANEKLELRLEFYVRRRRYHHRISNFYEAQETSYMHQKNLENHQYDHIKLSSNHITQCNA